MESLAKLAGISWPINSISEIDRFKMQAKQTEKSNWASLKSQGKGVKKYRGDRVGNCLLYNLQMLSSNRFITALKLRENVAANKTSTNRVTKHGSILCRHCKSLPESLGHILGQCTYTKQMRVLRHNQIRDFVENKILNKKEFNITKEPEISIPHFGKLKPDLLIHELKKIKILYIAICHEDNNCIQEIRETKISKYTELRETLTQNDAEMEYAVLRIIIGTRETSAALESVGLMNRAFLITLSMMDLRSSIEIYNKFMDYNQ